MELEKVYHCTLTGMPTNPVLSLINPVHAPTLPKTNYLKMHFNIILPSMPTHLIILDLITQIMCGEEYRS
jgi:hypothetical protein